VNAAIALAVVAAAALALSKKKSVEELVADFHGSTSDVPERPSPVTTRENRVIAERVSLDVQARGQDYDVEGMKAFQRSVGLDPTGAYGPKEASALLLVLGERPPDPIAYTLPVEAPDKRALSLQEEGKARALADYVDRNIKERGFAYDRVLAREFQKSTRALYADGFYGPATAGAVAYFTERAAPPPFYKAEDGTFAVIPFRPSR
jgi:hypothetical protein